MTKTILQNAPFRTGHIAVVGRPNVGKSTLVNHLIGQKLSITSRKAQTTRHTILGIYTDSESQLIMVDTPGWQTRYRDLLHQWMNRSVRQTLGAVDAILFVVEAGRFLDEEALFLQQLPAAKPVVLVVNKLDRLPDPVRMLPFLSQMDKRFPFHAVIPVIAKSGYQCEKLRDMLRPLMPITEALYAADAITDRSERFLAAEHIREKIFRLLGAELPYALHVAIESFQLSQQVRHVRAAILVDRMSQKAILIGKRGERLKQIGTEARVALETLFGGKVCIKLWVKVKRGWADDALFLGECGVEGAR